MPTYGYRCAANGHEFEVIQGINEPPLATCQECGEPVTRIFYPVGIVFKGPGFYKTDSRGSSSSSTPAPSSGGEGAPAKTAESKPETKSESKSETPKSDKAETRKSSTGGESKSS